MPTGNQRLELRGETLSTAIAALALLFGHTAAAQTFFDASLTEAVETVRITASGQRFVPRQSLTPGGAPRHTANYDVTVTWNPGAWQAREEWQLDTVYPLQTSFAYNMTYSELAGVKDGQDNFRAALDGPTPLAAARIGANFKDLWHTNPLILAAHSEASLPPVEFDTRRQRPATHRADGPRHGVDPGRRSPPRACRRRSPSWNRTPCTARARIAWSSPTGRRSPACRSRSRSSSISTAWTAAPGNPVGHRGEPRRRGQRAHGTGRHRARQCRSPGLGMGHVAHAARPRRPRRDLPIPRKSRTSSFLEVGPDIYQIIGGSHHGLAVVGPDGIAVVDAPWYPERSDTLLRLLAERWPDRPRALHHHDPPPSRSLRRLPELRRSRRNAGRPSGRPAVLRRGPGAGRIPRHACHCGGWPRRTRRHRPRHRRIRHSESSCRCACGRLCAGFHGCFSTRISTRPAGSYNSRYRCRPCSLPSATTAWTSNGMSARTEWATIRNPSDCTLSAEPRRACVARFLSPLFGARSV